MQRTVLALVLASCMATFAFAQGPDVPIPGSKLISDSVPMPKPAPGQPADYAAGLKAMNDGKWKEALADFNNVHGAKDDIMSQALYWKAYNLQKLNRNDDANNTCSVLQQKYPQSTWVSECFVLQANKVFFIQKDGSNGDIIQLQELAGMQADQERQYAESARNYANRSPFIVTTDGPGSKSFVIHSGKVDSDDEIKLIALNSLMRQEPDKALPIVRNFIESDKSIEARRRALFVLEQSKSPEAQKMFVDLASSTKEPELQRAAIWALASSPKGHTSELVSIYRASTDHEVKRAAASGLRSANDSKDLVDLARSESDPDIKRTLVTYLSEMHDPDALNYMESLLK